MAVFFEANSDFSKAVKDYERLQRENVKLKESMSTVTKEVTKQGTSAKATFEGGLGQIKSMVTGYLSFSGAISLVNHGLQEQKKLSQEIHRVQMTAADAQAEVVKNLGNVTTDQASKFLKDVEEISQKGGSPSVAPVYAAAAATISAVAGDESLTKNILAEAVPIFRSNLGELPQFAGAVGDLATIAGATTREQIRGIIGMVLTSQTQARIVSLDAFKNAAPALAATASVDTGPDRIRALKEGGALFAAIGGAIKDPEGALTKTATSEVATALNDLLPEKDVFDASGEVTRKGTGLKTLGERLAAVQADVTLQRRFWQTGDGMQAASFRGPIQPIIRQLIGDKESEAAIRFRKAMGVISADPNVTNQIVTNLGGGSPQLKLAASTRQSAGVIEKFQLGSTAGNTALAREVLGKGLENTGGFFGSAIGNWVEKMSFEADLARGVNPLEAAQIALRERKEQTIFAGFDPRGQYVSKVDRARSDPEFERREAAKLSADEKSKVDVLDRLISVLEKQLALSSVGGTAAAAQALRNHTEVR